MVGQSPRIQRVTIEYENGLTMVYEDAALDQWVQVYYEGLTARALLAQQNQAQAQAGQAEMPSNVRNLRDALRQADPE